MLLFRLLKYISFVADLAILIVIYYAYRAIKGIFTREKWSFSEWIRTIGDEAYSLAGRYSIIILIVALVSVLLTSTVIHQLVGINNLELKPSGTYCFYVEATNASDKTYTLPAQIRVEKETEEVREGKERTYTYYYIEKVFFSDGEYLDAKNLDEVQIGKASTFYDDSDHRWQLVLLNEHAYSPQVKETNNADWLSTTFLLVELFSLFVLLYALIKKEIRADT